MVVTYNGQPIEAVYHQSGGGQTENSRDVGRYVPYLAQCEGLRLGCTMYNWEKALPASEIERRLSTRGYAVGKLESIRLSPLEGGSKMFGNDRTASGRVQEMLFSGSGGHFFYRTAGAGNIRAQQYFF
ncbi:MAG: hypothetical protein ACLRXQ_10380 [Phascolarctobacterium faecium]